MSQAVRSSPRVSTSSGGVAAARRSTSTRNVARRPAAQQVTRSQNTATRSATTAGARAKRVVRTSQAQTTAARQTTTTTRPVTRTAAVRASQNTSVAAARRTARVAETARTVPRPQPSTTRSSARRLFQTTSSAATTPTTNHTPSARSRPVNTLRRSTRRPEEITNNRRRSTANTIEAATASSEEWSCPRCTLLNPSTARRCEACSAVNPALRRNSAPDGHPMLLRPSRGRPRGQVGMLRRVGENGDVATTMILPGGHDDPLMNLMFLSLLGRAAAGGATEGVDVQRLLRAMGGGAGASEMDIQSLPTSRIQNPDKEIPEEGRECAICLEEFQAGEERKVLPCLHGYHADCINRALRVRSCCPICNHDLNE